MRTPPTIVVVLLVLFAGTASRARADEPTADAANADDPGITTPVAAPATDVAPHPPLLPCPFGTHRSGDLCVADSAPAPTAPAPTAPAPTAPAPTARPPLTTPTRPLLSARPPLSRRVPKHHLPARSSTMPSYGGYVFLLDLAALSTTAIGVGLNEEADLSTAAMGVGFFIYMVGPPVLHGVKAGSALRVLGSFALRIGAPWLGASIGLVAIRTGDNRRYDDDKGSFPDSADALGGLIVGGLAGLLTAAIVDAAVIAGPYERRGPIPMVSVTPTGAPVFGIGGRF